MNISAIVMMICICALVWGGFLSFLCAVWRIEKRKTHPRADEVDKSQTGISG